MCANDVCSEEEIAYLNDNIQSIEMEIDNFCFDQCADIETDLAEAENEDCHVYEN